MEQAASGRGKGEEPSDFLIFQDARLSRRFKAWRQDGMMIEEAGGRAVCRWRGIGGGQSQDLVGVNDVKQVICSRTVSGGVCGLSVCKDV